MESRAGKVQLPPCSDVFLGIKRAILCALIINELVSNAMKHGFPPHIDFRNTNSLGMQLVTELTAPWNS